MQPITESFTHYLAESRIMSGVSVRTLFWLLPSELRPETNAAKVELF